MIQHQLTGLHTKERGIKSKGVVPESKTGQQGTNSRNEILHTEIQNNEDKFQRRELAINDNGEMQIGGKTQPVSIHSSKRAHELLP